MAMDFEEVKRCISMLHFFFSLAMMPAAVDKDKLVKDKFDGFSWPSADCPLRHITTYERLVANTSD
jgi:hypothetical protein